MAIVRSQDGKFYDVDDNALEGKEVKREDLPKELQGRGEAEPGGAGVGGGGMGAGNLAGLIQIIVNLPEGAPPPTGGKPGEGAQAGAGGEEDVAGHNFCWANNWRNVWRNCWRNCWRNSGWANQSCPW